MPVAEQAGNRIHPLLLFEPGDNLCLNFDGSEYVDLGDNIVVGDTFTLEAWIYPAMDDTGYDGFLGYQPSVGATQRSLLYGLSARKKYTRDLEMEQIGITLQQALY
jgi:hypothetical protein